MAYLALSASSLAVPASARASNRLRSFASRAASSAGGRRASVTETHHEELVRYVTYLDQKRTSDKKALAGWFATAYDVPTECYVCQDGSHIFPSE